MVQACLRKVDTDRYPVRSRSLARRGPSFGASVRAGRVSDAAATVGVPSAESTCSDGRAVPARRRCFATGVRHWRDASRRALWPLNESDLTLLVRFEWNLEAGGRASRTHGSSATESTDGSIPVPASGATASCTGCIVEKSTGTRPRPDGCLLREPMDESPLDSCSEPAICRPHAGPKCRPGLLAISGSALRICVGTPAPIDGCAATTCGAYSTVDRLG